MFLKEGNGGYESNMLYEVAELVTQIPDVGDMPERAREYRYAGSKEADIIINPQRLCVDNWPGLSENNAFYMETGFHFYGNLLNHQGMILHASAVELDGRAYLFSGDSGAGKSTHTGLYQQVFGQRAQVFNDDKPALRRLDGKWFAYGTPWCGKNGINQNKKVPLAGICFLKQAQENKIRRLSQGEIIQRVVKQTMRRFVLAENLNTMLGLLENLVWEVPVFELENRPEPEAVFMSYQAMCPKTKE